MLDNKQISEIMKDNSFDNMDEDFPFINQQLDEIQELRYLKQDMYPKYIPNFLYEIHSSDIKINPNNDLNLITKTKNTTLLNNKTKREEFNFEGNKMNNEISNRIELEITNENIPRINEKTKKKGRKKKSEKNNASLAKDQIIHTKNDDDNIIVKIKTFFLNNFHKFINGLIKESKMKLKNLDPIIKVNIKQDYNIKLWNTTFKTIYSEEKICKKYNICPDKNKKIIDEIYKNNSDDELIKILNLTFGEVFEIFIKDLKELNSELLTKVENYEIYKNVEFSNLDYFFNKMKEQGKKDGQSDEFIGDYINEIKTKCIYFKNWFDEKIGRERKKRI